MLAAVYVRRNDSDRRYIVMARPGQKIGHS